MTYLVILSDMDGNVDWQHPMEIEATDKNDAKMAIADSCPIENIKKVLTVNEYNAFMSNKGNQARIKLDGEVNYESGKDFFAQMLKAADDQNTQDENPVSQEIPEQPEPQRAVQEVPVKKEEKPSVRYFTDNGIMYKVENGVLFKKCWENLPLEETTDEATGNTVLPEFRIINADTGKPIKSSKYCVQHLVWQELNNI